MLMNPVLLTKHFLYLSDPPSTDIDGSQFSDTDLETVLFPGAESDQPGKYIRVCEEFGPEAALKAGL